jgi:type II secretory pathway component GspD/PulD (secretin)
VAAGTPVSAILLAGTEKSVQEARELIEKLDKPAATASVELTVVESAGNSDDLAGQIRDATAAGPVTDEAWRTLVKRLQTEGKITLFRTLEVKVAENQQARIQVGEEKPIATGAMTSARGIASRNFTYRNVGSMATLTLRPVKAGEYRVDLKLEDSRILAAKPQPEAPKEKDKEKDKEKEKAVEEFKPDSVLQFTAETSANLSPGKVVQVNSNREESKDGSRQVLVFLRLKSS